MGKPQLMFEWCWTIKELYKFKHYVAILNLKGGISSLGLPIIPTRISTLDDTKRNHKKVYQNQKGFIKCLRKSRSWEKCLDVFVTMTLVRVEPEETLGGLSAHDIIWNGSFSVTRGVFKWTNHRSANRLLSNALFPRITAPKTRFLKKYT